jgi:hypothetical protein
VNNHPNGLSDVKALINCEKASCVAACEGTSGGTSGTSGTSGGTSGTSGGTSGTSGGTSGTTSGSPSGCQNLGSSPGDCPTAGKQTLYDCTAGGNPTSSCVQADNGAPAGVFCCPP